MPIHSLLQARKASPFQAASGQGPNYGKRRRPMLSGHSSLPWIKKAHHSPSPLRLPPLKIAGRGFRRPCGKTSSGARRRGAPARRKRLARANRHIPQETDSGYRFFAVFGW